MKKGNTEMCSLFVLDNFTFVRYEKEKEAESLVRTVTKSPTAIECAACQVGKGCCQWSVVLSRKTAKKPNFRKQEQRTSTQFPTNKGGEQILNPPQTKMANKLSIPTNNSDELNLRPKQNGTLRATKVIKLT